MMSPTTTKEISRSIRAIKHDKTDFLGKGHVIDVLENMELNGIKTNSVKEVVGVICSNPKGKRSKFSELDAKADEVSATITMNPEDIRAWCPSNHILTYVHTHNLGTGTMSDADRKSATDLYLSNMAEGLCAIGIDKISCHYPRLSPPTVLDIPMRKTFYKKLLDMIDGDKNGDEFPKRFKVDAVTCFKDDPKKSTLFACTGKRWENGLQEFPIGVFSNLIGVDVTTDHSSQYVAMFDEKTASERASMDCGAFGNKYRGETLVCML